MTADGSDLIAEVLKLGLVDGLSVRAIAKRLGMARRTVRAALGRKLPEQRPVAPRPYKLDEHLPTIKALLDKTPELSAPGMLERLRPLGYSGGVSVLRDRMRVLRGNRPREAFNTLQFHPAEAVQVDWADFGFAIPGCPRRVSAFVMALCHSRYLYLEFTLSQAMPTFLRCMERGLAFFGGTTLNDIFDNMKTVVIKPGPPTIFNRTFLAYAGVRGFAVRACNPGRGNEKGRVERPIGWLARCVDVHRHGINRQVHIHAHVGPAGIDTGTHVIVFVPKTIGYRVLDFECGKVQAGQRAVLGGDLDLEGLLGRKPDLPRHIGCGVVQVLLAAVLVVGQFNQHPLRQAAVQI